MIIEELLLQAIADDRECEITYGGDYERVIQPYIIGMAKHGQAVLAYQVSGFSASGHCEGWKCLHIEKIDYVTLTENRFIPQAMIPPKWISR